MKNFLLLENKYGYNFNVLGVKTNFKFSRSHFEFKSRNFLRKASETNFSDAMSMFISFSRSSFSFKFKTLFQFCT